MAKKALLFLVLVFSVFSVGINTVWAEDIDVNPETTEDPVLSEETTSNTREKATAWGPSYDQNQMEAYREAVEQDGCATPSLECLVHQTSRFVAIEWVNNILYPGTKGTAEDSNLGEEEASLNTGSFVGGITHLMGEMYRYPAARTSVFVADVLENAHVITPAYAQGLGFASLNPILELWKVFRNISYMMFVLIFIVLGFMIMFRQKIGSQSAVTAQQAIPSVIASLIFVTFSYAIAGFLIDMMYLLMFMIIGVFGQTSESITGNIIDFNIFNLMGTLNGAIGISKGAFETNIDIVSNLLGSLVNSSEAGTNLGGIIGGITLSLVLAVAVLIGTFKLFFELLKSYATVVLHVVTAPLVLMGGAIPGKNSFGPWLKNIVANLSAFPVVLMVVILFYQFTEKASTSGGFIPPFLLGRGQSGAITTLMGLAIILALPEIVKDVKTKLGATDGFGTMIFNAAGARAKQSLRSVETGAPVVAGVVGGGLGAGVAYKQARKEGLKGRKLLGAMATGTTVKDAQGNKKVVGGALQWGKKTYDTGQTARKYIDRAAEGRLFAAEDTDKLLARLAEGRKKPEQTSVDSADPGT
jgi:hypothetical protein